MEKINFERIAAIVICAAAAAFAVWAIFRYALGILLPFLVGIALGGIVRRPAAYIAKKTAMQKKFWGVTLYILLLLIICLAAFLAVNRLIGELLELTEVITSGGGASLEATIGNISDYISNLTSRLPVIRDIREKSGNAEFWERVDLALADSVKNAVSQAAAYIPQLAGKIIAAMPEAFVFLTVSLITGFFFSSGSVDLKAFEKWIPESRLQTYLSLKGRLTSAAGAWFRAYMLLLGLTFFELFIGFTVLGVNYSFLAAIAVALVDLLPIFGVGTVLVPWAIVMLFTGNRFVGVGLLVLWAVISIIRQFAEPKIVGKSLGVSPILTLLSMYAGLRIFGIAGMIAAPAVIIFAKSFFGGKKRPLTEDL